MTKQERPSLFPYRGVRDLDPKLVRYRHEEARKRAAEWQDRRGRLEHLKYDRTLIDRWTEAQKRAFAIETGQVENLYLLRRGVTETLISEGFEGVRGAHSAIEIEDRTLEGLLSDQAAALEMLFSHVKEERSLNISAMKEWHSLLTRHQGSAAGIDPVTGRILQIQLRRGQFKVSPNNPRADGHVFEYCPPEQTQQQMEIFVKMHEGHRLLDLSPEIEAAWLHYQFVRIHPFQDGNGRVARLLMAFPYIRAGEFPPIISSDAKEDYYNALEDADRGGLEAFAEYLGDLACLRSLSARRTADRILKGARSTRTANGGRYDIERGYIPPANEAE